MSRLSTALFIIAGLVLMAAAAGAKDDAQNEAKNEVRDFATRSGLHFYAGGDVDVADKAETAFAAGGTVRVTGQEIGEVIAAGGTVDIPDIKTTRIIAAGGTVDIDKAEIAKTIIATGGTVKVKEAKVLGDVILSGGEVRFTGGEVGGDFIGTGGSVKLAGTFAGDVTLRGGELKLDPATRIAGNLTYASKEELNVPDGIVSGTIIRKAWRHGEGFGEFSLLKFLAGVALFLVSVVLGLFVFAAVVLALFGGYVARGAGSVTDKTVESLGIGVLVSIVVPVTILVLFITIIGIPLALFTMAAYAVLFGLGIVVAAYWLGMKVRNVLAHDGEPRYMAKLGWTFLGLVVFTFVGAIPFVGALAQFFALVTGAGAFILGIMGDRQKAIPVA